MLKTFAKTDGIKSRLSKIAALAKLNDAEARKVRKQMNVHNYRSGRINLIGFYHPNGKHPVRCK